LNAYNEAATPKGTLVLSHVYCKKVEVIAERSIYLTADIIQTTKLKGRSVPSPTGSAKTAHRLADMLMRQFVLVERYWWKLCRGAIAKYSLVVYPMSMVIIPTINR